MRSAVLSVMAVAVSFPLVAQDAPPPDRDRLQLSVVPFCLDEETIGEAIRALRVDPAVREYLHRTRHRLLSFELVDPADLRDVKIKNERVMSEHYRATFYDYTNNRTVVATGHLFDPGLVRVEAFGTQPLPSSEEFAAAVDIVAGDGPLREAIRAGALVPYRPMPPILETELADGRVERTLAVGLLPTDGRARHEIVAANLVRNELLRFERGAPLFAMAGEEVCDPPADANGTTAAKGTPGTVRVTVKQGGTVLWKFHAVRPAASSGMNGSGVELRYLEYRGKRVLYRAHVPILNVRYEADSCGPYRDWQWEEGQIQAVGVDVAPGFRYCTAPATTMLDTGNDSGNFLGTAIYVDGQEVVLVSEMEAGWYRYVSEWRLHADGTIRPRFGFDAVADSCTCNRHFHHAYWRFDFDIRTAGNNVVHEFNDPPIVGGSNWHTKSYEIRRTRDASRKRRWRISNKSTGEGYTLIPGSNDGTQDAFGIGDTWILRYRGNELEDGQGFTTDPAKAKANLAKFLDGETVDGRDVVVWYAGHFTHQQGSGASHIVGPTLAPHDW